MKKILESIHFKKEIAFSVPVINIEKRFSNERTLTKQFLPHNEYFFTKLEELQNLPKHDSISYKMNNEGHRSEDFFIIESEKSALFCGCSFTFGESLPYMDNWSGRLYNKINKGDFDGYKSISFLGGSIELIINNVYNYIEKYGKPSNLFILFPEISRSLSYIEDEYFTVVSKNQKDHKYKTFEDSIFSTYLLIKSLEHYCKESGISLIWSSWDEDSSKIFNELGFFDFIYIEQSSIIKMAKNKNERGNILYNIARDNAHPGLMYSDGVSEIFLKEYNDKSN